MGNRLSPSLKAHGEHEMRLVASWYECRYCRCLMAGQMVYLYNKPCVAVDEVGR